MAGSPEKVRASLALALTEGRRLSATAAATRGLPRHPSSTTARRSTVSTGAFGVIGALCAISVQMSIRPTPKPPDRRRRLALRSLIEKYGRVDVVRGDVAITGSYHLVIDETATPAKIGRASCRERV